VLELKSLNGYVTPDWELGKPINFCKLFKLSLKVYDEIALIITISGVQRIHTNSLFARKLDMEYGHDFIPYCISKKF